MCPSGIQPLQLLTMPPLLLWHYFAIRAKLAKILCLQARYMFLQNNVLTFSLLHTFSTGGATRTPDTWFWRPVLYQLSYTRE